MPVAGERFMGVDLTLSEARPSACALLEADGSLSYLAMLKADSDIVALARSKGASTVGVDSPLGLPKGMCCLEEGCGCRSVHPFKGRVCEGELMARGISLYVTTKRSFIKPMIYRAIRLAETLEASGCRVLEVYPYAAKVALFGRPIPPKTTREGIAFLRLRLERLIPGLSTSGMRLNHDLCDALVAAYTAYLHARDRTESVGLNEEVAIVLPKASA